MARSSNLRQKLTLVVLGRSGSGKGTQARLIVKRLKRNVAHLETGRFLRELLGKRRNSTTEKARREIMGDGRLFPSWFAVYTWLKKILEGGIAGMHWVFDGAPRRLFEAKLIDEVAEWHGRMPPVCVYLRIEEKEAVSRMKARGRQDDNMSSIRNRMEFFSEEVVPVIEYYKKQGRLIEVNGNQAVEDVWKELDSKLKKRLGPLWPS